MAIVTVSEGTATAEMYELPGDPDDGNAEMPFTTASGLKFHVARWMD